MSTGKKNNSIHTSVSSKSSNRFASESSRLKHGGDDKHYNDLKKKMDGWWSIGDNMKKNGVHLTHQSARLTMPDSRVFCDQKEEIWDLTDSVMELYENEHRIDQSAKTLQFVKKSKYLDSDIKSSDIQEWLSMDAGNGFIRVYAPDMSNFSYSELVPCTLNTSAHKICLQLGIGINALHIQLNGDTVRRLDPHELPLVIQNDYLVALGYNNIIPIQEEGTKEDLAYLIKFYSGKPMYESTFSQNRLQANIQIKKGGLLQQWIHRLCVISGTRLLVYKDNFKNDEPSAIQLAGGSVEELKLKGHDHCLKLTCTWQGEKQIYLSFATGEECNKWFRKCKKATDKLPSAADLSSCHLEYLPENIFVNSQLTMLNLQHNALKERPVDEDACMIGWIEDIARFNCLRSLNLADNNLQLFPLSLCNITTLVELNLASNKLVEIPADIQLLQNLQAIHIHNNHLTSLPEEIVSLHKLFILVLAFNRFVSLPPVVAQMTNVRVSEVENIIMAGNQIEKISSETLMEMKHVKKLDLRMNRLTLPLTETMKFTVLEHITHFDIRDNQVSELDLRSLKTLEYLNCERNGMTNLQLNGTSLKLLFASCNCLDQLIINPKPEWLSQIDLSDNCLEALPDWLSDCFLLQKVNVSENFLRELPSRIFVDAKKLKYLKVAHNHLLTLPVEIGCLVLEELFVQHNYISRLPHDFLQKANKLRIFNASKNRLINLPLLNENLDLNKVQELYLSNNLLGNNALEVISGYSRLKILHLAHNEITELDDQCIKKLDLLQEINISTNQLQILPPSLGQLTKLVVLRAHSNFLNELPDFHNAKSLRVLDVGHNQLLNVSVTDLMASQLNLLDMSLNKELKVNPREFKTVRNKKSICLVDLSGQNRRLPGLPQKHIINPQRDLQEDSHTAWKVGFSETSGMRNKLCVAMIKLLTFNSDSESLFGMFDGGHNNELPKMLVEKIADIVKDEIKHHKTPDKFMKYAMLSAHRCLKLSGQRLGVSAVLCHLYRQTGNDINNITLSIANVGDIEAVLCRHGDAVLLTRKFVTTADQEECQRVYKSDGIITEDCKVNGITQNTRLLGCAYLYPHIIPDPFTAVITLQKEDEFVVVANCSFWKYVSYEEAVEEIYEIGNPIVASKHLQDLAEGYGSKENVAVLVIRLNTEHGPSLGRLRPTNRELSVDDVEAAMQHEAQKAKRTTRMALAYRSSKKNARTSVHLSLPPTVSHSRLRQETLLNSSQTRQKLQNSSIEPAASGNNSAIDQNTITPTKVVTSINRVEAVVDDVPMQITTEIKKKNIPEKQRFVKKGMTNDNSDSSNKHAEKNENIDNSSSPKFNTDDLPGTVLFHRNKTATQQKIGVFSPNPAYSYASNVDDNDLIKMMSKTMQPKQRGSIANTIAMFEASKVPNHDSNDVSQVFKNTKVKPVNISDHSILSNPLSNSTEFHEIRLPSDSGSPRVIEIARL